jgi:hypothetical protein
MKKMTNLLKHAYVIMIGLCSATLLQAQVPLASTDVMLQAFRWDSHQATNWSTLNSQAAEIAGSFSLVWLPPSAAAEGGGGSNVGYHPYQWSNQNSSWGTRSQLETLIGSLKSGGARTIADIVINHRATNNGWCGGFSTDNFGTYGTFTLGANTITKDDEAAGRSECAGKLSTHNDHNWNVQGDMWGGYGAARDLAHSMTEVQDAVTAYLKWMKNVIGYDGWRYDLVKGFWGQHLKQYNQAAGAYLSVGEFYDSNFDNLKNWVNSTDKQSMVFDFAAKNAIFSWGGGDNYNALAWMDGNVRRPAGLMHSAEMRQYAVTFVDNHDTSWPHPTGAGWEYKGDLAKANAFLLSSPGIPCVAWRDWVAIKSDIKKMIAARKSVGLHSNSDVRVTNTQGYYESHGIGKTGELICRIGNWSGEPAGFTFACGGTGWAYYTKGGSGDGGNNGGGGGTVNPPAGNYYVAGQAALCGVAWSPNADANKMTQSGSVWTKTYTDIPAGTYEYKITDGTWDNTWNNTGSSPGAAPNASFTLTATSTVTLSFDGSKATHQIAGTGGGTGGGGVGTTQSYFVAGSAELCGVAWNPNAEANKMIQVGTIWEKTYSNVPAGTHMYKVTDGTWIAPSPWNQQGSALGEGTHEEIILSQTATVTIKFDGTKVLPPTILTSIKDALFDASVIAVSETIFVSEDVFSIYNLTGIDVTYQNGNLPNGVYIVRLSNGAAKIVALR